LVLGDVETAVWHFPDGNGKHGTELDSLGSTKLNKKQDFPTIWVSLVDNISQFSKN